MCDPASWWCGHQPGIHRFLAELMLLALKVDPKVATVWIYQLWQFAQIMNLFIQQKGLRVE
jgi:hypothetical protein